MRSFRLAGLELRRFGRGRLPRAAMAALMILPLLYGALYLWSFWDPYGRLDRVPVALVNADRGATVGGKKLNAGDDITHGLRRSKSFDWQVVDADEAAEGVENGTYYLSLTIPRDFSSRVGSSSGDHPETGALRVRTNDANNYIVGQISRTVFSEVRTAASTKASRGFYDKIFVSFSDLHDKTEKAGKGADDLEQGAGKLHDGASRLSDGLSTAEKGSGDLADGLGRLGRGTRDLARGAHTAASGTQQLADKVNKASDTYRPFVRDHADEIEKAARLVAKGSKVIKDDLGKLPATTSKAAADARKAADDLEAVYADQCPGGTAGPACPQLKRAVKAARDVAGVAADVDSAVQKNKPALEALSKDLDRVHDLATQIADTAPHLLSTLDNAVRKVNDLNNGVHDLADGADTVAASTGTAHQGAKKLHDGIGDLADGSDTLVNGLYKLSDGAGHLATGLHDGAKKIPDYSGSERDHRASVMSDPVQLANKHLNRAPNYGTGFAPYFIPLALWVGTMVGYMLMRPLSDRALAAGARSWRIAVAGWLPVAAVGVLQAGALLAVLHWAVGLDMVRAAGTIGFLALTVASFAAIMQWLNAQFGAAGRLLALALLMLQLTSAGGTYPVQTSPRFFNAVHPFLPMSYVVDGLRHLISGGGTGPVWRACAVLAAFGLASLAATTWAARRKQVWSMSRLHPELSL
ncbi:YhgE/Pip domain-containing protein [Wenjunlia tyrosinilytica]|uniref:Membrane protein n=1 Tax=Wenjunlia tyrosinilytica TaxID=1544741 RepID=A0A918DT79_9ACTN|nr:YhgE/Pip domain-containing protein [Wenjunlia tyrosinilytica]GGO81838.1 membrane protein [Wenjunlia tyrosinilytica]